MIPKNVHEAALRAKNDHIKRLEDATRALVENFDADLLLSRIRQGTTAEELLEAERDALRARVARLEETLKRGVELHENCDADICMCGEVMWHTLSGHKPSAMLQYYGDQWAEEARRALEEK